MSAGLHHFHERPQQLVLKASLVILLAVGLYTTMHFASAAIHNLAGEVSHSLSQRTAGGVETGFGIRREILDEFLLILIGPLELIGTTGVLLLALALGCCLFRKASRWRESNDDVG
jgi:hypothetical protein